MVHSKHSGSVNTIRRQKQIEDCLYSNLLQRPYTSVSVSDLCHQLEISRKSFYNYFPDKDSCFRSFINRKIRQCVLSVTSSRSENATLDDYIFIFLDFWKQERPFLDILTRNNLLTMLLDQCIIFLQEEDTSVLEYLNTPQLKTDEFVLACYVNTQILLVIQWYKGNYEISREEMVCKYKRLIYEPLLSL
jgi:AcrR family transcriptional regulator